MNQSIQIWSYSNNKFLPVTQFYFWYKDSFKIINPNNFKYIKLTGRILKIYSPMYKSFIYPSKIFVVYTNEQRKFSKSLKLNQAHLYLKINKNNKFTKKY